MKTTLSLDADVAALLDRAHHEHGRSWDELGNELLRQTLKRLHTALPATEQLEATLEAQIDQLYVELGDLIARSAEDPELESEIELKRQQLHWLQANEAEAWRQQADAGRHLKPGEGYRLLERAERLLAS